MEKKETRDGLRYLSGYSYIHNRVYSRFGPDDDGATMQYTDQDGLAYDLIGDDGDDVFFAEMLDSMLGSRLAQKELVKRYAHTLKRLRQKGYCHEKSIAEFRESFSRGSEYAIDAASTWSTIMLLGDNRELTITDEMWYTAFDKLLIFKDRKLLREQDRSIIPFCIDHMAELYMLMDDAIAQAVAEMRFDDAMHSLCRKQKLFTRDECRELTQKTCEKLTEEINDFYAEQRKEFEAGKATIEFLSSEGERLAKELSALRRENKALEKECYQLRKENGAMGEELARVAALGLEETSPLPDTDTEDDLLDSYVVDDADVNEPEELPELPDTGIMFVGGHPNFLKKLREVYPDWSYITKENVPERLRQYSKQKMCYIYTAHTSHPIYWGVINALRNCDTPYSYIKGTNLDRVITEMRQDYAEAYKNNKGDERHD